MGYALLPFLKRGRPRPPTLKHNPLYQPQRNQPSNAWGGTVSCIETDAGEVGRQWHPEQMREEKAAGEAGGIAHAMLNMTCSVWKVVKKGLAETS